MTKQYILLKDSPELKKGAILEEQCEDEDQDFTCKDKGFFKFKDQDSVYYSRNTIMKQPKWFESVNLIAVPQSQMLKVKKLLAELKGRSK